MADLITDEMVEAAARAMYSETYPAESFDEEESKPWADVHRRRARTALAAVLTEPRVLQMAAEVFRGQRRPTSMHVCLDAAESLEKEQSRE